MSIKIRFDTETFGTKLAFESFFIGMYIGNMSNGKKDGLRSQQIKTKQYARKFLFSAQMPTFLHDNFIVLAIFQMLRTIVFDLYISA